MNGPWKKILWGTALLPILPAAWLAHLYYSSKGQAGAVYAPGTPLQIAVADPLSRVPACAGGESLGTRDYSVLAAYLEERLGRTVRVHCVENLRAVFRSKPVQADLLIGRAWAVQSEAARANETVRPIARLTDADGRTDVAGLFVVRQADKARSIRDLTDRRILFGPPDARERHGDAKAVLAEHGVVAVPPVRIAAGCAAAASAVIEGNADVAIISDYALGLLEGHNGIERDALRVIGSTPPVPFITVFATSRVTEVMERRIVDALLSTQDEPQLLAAMDSQTGFIGLQEEVAVREAPSEPPLSTECTERRCGDGHAISPHVPARLPTGVSYLWRRGLTGAGLSGVAATSRRVLVADKSERKDQDIWRCLDADTGQELWTIAYATPTEMEFTNAPRATPVIHGDLAYLLGAFGDLHCVSLRDSRILWRRNIIKDFGAELGTWGVCSTPLVVDDKLIVNPGALDASLAALSLETGEVLWTTPGEQAAYASLILGTFGGVRQIVGYDAVSLGGWDPNTGQRLWRLAPPERGDYHVTTPVDIDGRLLLSTRKNGTRLYEFDAGGQIRPVPVAWNADLNPDTATPVVVNDLVFGCSEGLLCLDLNDGLRTLQRVDDDKAFKTHAAFIAGSRHVLAASVDGELVLLEASPGSLVPVSRLRLFRDGEVWSRPALLGDRLYIRSMKEICCILLGDAPTD